MPLVSSNHQAHQYVTCQVDRTGSQPCLAVGLPVKSSRAGVLGLYCLFLDAEQTAASVTRNTVIIIGVALVVMLALMAWLVTQMVVRQGEERGFRRLFRPAHGGARRG